MSRYLLTRRSVLSALVGGACAWPAMNVLAQDPMPSRLREPVFRVANNNGAAKSPAHPLDPALDYATTTLQNIRTTLTDYTCTIVKRERVNGTLNDYEYMFAKVRNRKVDNGQLTTPLSVYLYFLKPSGVKGREVIYVDGQNNDKMCAHEGGLQGRLLPTVWLKPDSMLAMRGQLYPITEIGIENLVIKLIERGEREKSVATSTEVQVEFRKGAKINGRECTLLEVKHPTKRPTYDFFVAQIFIDDELNLPVRYAAYDWPETPEGRPGVLEEYTYLDIKTNVGLTDQDFDPHNPNYNFYRK
ncbi:MAG: DUF1571 domain-containing protein [Pirellulaceae bacterium]|nr:DUF1571 domain-containing protein [Planctomycetales bacterium]